MRRARQLGASREEAEQFLSELKKDGFVNDARFAELYVRSKFRQNQWGRRKIWAALEAKSLDRNLIALAINTIDEEEYRQQADKLIEKKRERKQAVDSLFQYMKNKGYEGELIYSLLEEKGLI